jgi:hypothetical protein
MMYSVKDLKDQIKDLPDDMEVFIRCHVNPVGNMSHVGEAAKSTYGFFGTSIPCLIIEPLKDDKNETR